MHAMHGLYLLIQVLRHHKTTRKGHGDFKIKLNLFIETSHLIMNPQLYILTRIVTMPRAVLYIKNQFKSK